MKEKKFYLSLFFSLVLAVFVGIFIFYSIRDNNSVDTSYYEVQDEANLAEQQKQNVKDKYGTEGLFETEISTPQYYDVSDNAKEYSEDSGYYIEQPSDETGQGAFEGEILDSFGSASDTEATIPSSDDNGFELTVLDVGQGSCALISCDGHYMVFDGGDRDTSSFVVSYLSKTRNISDIDYVIASHYDSDHIAGLIGILKNFNVQNIFGPDYSTDTKTYQSFMSAASQKSGLVTPPVTSTYSLGSATFTVVSPLFNYEEENSNSLGIEINYGSTSYLIMGDATTETELDCIENNMIHSVDVLVLNHHGSSSSTCKEFIEVTNPSAIAISVGKDNDYGHPHEKVMNIIKDYTVFRTDINGTITFESKNGETIDVFTER